MQQLYNNARKSLSIWLVAFGLVVSTLSALAEEPQVNTQVKTDVKPESCILLAPFANLVPTTNEASRLYSQEGGVIVTRLLGESMIHSRNFRIIEESTVTASLAEQNIILAKKIDLAQTLWIGRLFEATAVLVGTVSEYSYQFERQLPLGSPLVTIDAVLVSMASGDVLWRGRVSKSGKAWLQGNFQPLSEIAMQAVDELVSLLPRQNMDTAAESPLCGKAEISSDLDNDGIMNLADRCPNRPETKNAIDDFDGCPEVLTAETSYQQFLTLDADRLVLKEPIKFNAGSAEITDNAKVILKQMADFLLKNPQIKRVMIEGFSAPVTNEKFRERFAFSRATSVKQYLMQEGVEERRLIAVGYGAIEQQLNQEIEFTIVE